MEKKVYAYKNEVNYEFIKNILPLLKKYKVKEKDIDAIALSVEQSYHIGWSSGWSSGYNDCEMDIGKSIYQFKNMMDIYNINKKLAQEKLNSDKPIKWIAIYNNGKLEIRAGYVLYHKDLRKKDEPLPIGGGILKIESQSDANWKLSLGGKSDDFGACDLLSFKNEDI